MADTLGQFLNISIVKHSDEKPADIQPAPPLSLTATIPFEPPPTLSITASIAAFEPPPTLSMTASVLLHAGPSLSIPAVIPLEPAPILGVPAVVAFQKPPVLSITGSQPFQVAPAHNVPLPIEFQPPPTLSSPVEVPFEKPPTLSIPTNPPDMPAPPLNTPEPIQFEPPPALSITGSVPDMPAPVLSRPSDPPIMGVPSLSRPGELPIMRAPPLSSPTEIQLSPPPVLDQIHHPWTADDSPMGNPLDTDTHDHPGKQKVVFKIRAPQFMPDLPYYTFSDTQWHETVVMGAEQRKNTLAGFAYATGEAAFAAIASLHLDTNIMGFDFSFGAGGFSTNFNPQRIAENIRTIAISSVAGMAQGALTQIGIGVSNFFNPFGFTGAPGSGNPTVLQDVYVAPIDYVFTYHPDARAWQQNLQRRQAADNDMTMNSAVSSISSQYSVSNPFAPGNLYNENNTIGSQKADDPLAKVFDRNIQSVGGQLYSTRSPQVYQNTSKFPGEDSMGRTTDEVPDEKTVVPLVFTDLRTSDGTTRMVYFQPFITSLSEQITPRWNMANYFGRVDPVATYQNTGRTISLGFKLVAFSYTDLTTIFKKIGWLNSMCYPQYEDRMFKAGPIIRMRVGDLISSRGANKGVTGVITNLSMNYSQAIWELDVNAKLPRNIEVSLTFQVLHELPIGLGNDATTGQLSFGGVEDNGQADITKFRAAFGSIDYLSAGSGVVLNSGQIPDMTSAVPVPSVATGFLTENFDFASGGRNA